LPAAPAWPSDWRKLTGDQRRELAGLSPAELAALTGRPERTARLWAERVKQEVNGVQK
jgi:hypothetical protein